jgi:hypothetical protein
MVRVIWLVIFVFAPVFAVHAAVDPENIVGVWLLDEGRGDFAEDSSGNGHDGQIAGPEFTDGKFGKALQFERIGEVRIDSTEKLQLGEQLTMMAYFNTQALDDWHQIIAKDSEYLLRIDPPGEGTRMSAFVNLNGGWEPRASAFVPKKDTWYHFAAVYDSEVQQLRVYVDGVLSGQSGRAGKPNPGSAPVTFGHWGGGSRFVGTIDEVAIFDVALEEDDIIRIATDGLEAFLGAGKSVRPSGRLATTWGDLKCR